MIDKEKIERISESLCAPLFDSFDSRLAAELDRQEPVDVYYATLGAAASIIKTTLDRIAPPDTLAEMVEESLRIMGVMLRDEEARH
jgi:hypothetical protein